eukprot:g170.t1
MRIPNIVNCIGYFVLVSGEMTTGNGPFSSDYNNAGKSVSSRRLASFDNAVSEYISTPQLELEWERIKETRIIDENEWKNYKQVGDTVLHIDLHTECDVCLIAPLSANTMAKWCNGISDNLVTSILRVGFGQKRKVVIIAPAMNSNMWMNPITHEQLSIIRNRHGGRQSPYFSIVPPQRKKLACGVTGIGAMADPSTIALHVQRALYSSAQHHIDDNDAYLDPHPDSSEEQDHNTAAFGEEGKTRTLAILRDLLFFAVLLVVLTKIHECIALYAKK